MQEKSFNSSQSQGVTEQSHFSTPSAYRNPQGVDNLLYLQGFENFRMESGTINQQKFNVLNELIDSAQVGQEVHIRASLHEQFANSDKVVIYTHPRIGDTLLQVAIVDSIAMYYELNPENKVKQVEVITPFKELLQGLEEKYTFVKVTQVSQQHNVLPNRQTDIDIYEQYYKHFEENQSDKNFVITTGKQDVYERFSAIKNAGTSNVQALVDLAIVRYARGLKPWQGIEAYPARITRMMELILGQKLVDTPVAIETKLPLSHSMQEKREKLIKKYNLDQTKFHCLIESGSFLAKQLSSQQIGELLTGMNERINKSEEPRNTNSKIFLIEDPHIVGVERKLWNKMREVLPREVRDNIVVFNGSLEEIAALFSCNPRSVLSSDTGIAILAEACDIPTFVLFAIANPRLWNTGSHKFGYLASEIAMQVYNDHLEVHTPSFREERNEPKTARFKADEILDPWEELVINVHSC